LRLLALTAIALLFLYFDGVKLVPREWQWTANDDLRQVHCLHELHDPDSFEGDLLSLHCWHFQPIGIWAPYWLLGFLFPPYISAKLLGMALLALQALLIWFVAVSATDRQRPFGLGFSAAIALTVVLLLDQQLWWTTAQGLARSFGYVLTIMALLALTGRNWILLAAAVFLGALFSPTVAVISSLSGIVLWLATERKLLKTVRVFGFAVVFSGALLMAKSAAVPDVLDSFAKWRGPNKTQGFRENERSYRDRIRPAGAELSGHALSIVGSFCGSSGTSMVVFGVLVIAGGFVALQQGLGNENGGTSKPPAVLGLLIWVAACLLIYCAARLVAYRLYVPNRYLGLARPAEIMLLCLLLMGLIGRLFRRTDQSWPEAVFCAILIVAPIFHEVPPPSRASKPVITVPEEQRPLIAWMRANTDVGALFAGDPDTMDNVPLFAKRAVLINYEMSVPYFTNYYEAVLQRTNALIDAYFGSDTEDLLELRRCYGVDYLVIRTSDFASGSTTIWESESRPGPYMEPFCDHITEALRHVGSDDGSFAWQEVPEGTIAYRTQDFIVIDLGLLSG